MKNNSRRNLLVAYIMMSILGAGCGNLSKNQITHSSFILKNGYFQGRPIKTELVFKRYSWFKEATLMYDIRIAPISQEAPYFQWLAYYSQQDVKKCPQFYIALFYEKSSQYISHRFIANQLKHQGAEIQTLPDFLKSLKLHPQFEDESLKQYRLRGVCFKPQTTSIILVPPGYPSQVILE